MILNFGIMKKKAILELLILFVIALPIEIFLTMEKE